MAATNGIPRGTGHKEDSFYEHLVNSWGIGKIKTLKDVAMHKLSGELLDDKTYMMEHIIQLTASHARDGKDDFADKLTGKFLHELWEDLEHPPHSYLGYDHVFRKADGSNNNILYPHLGQAGQPYARSVRPKKMQPPKPDPAVVYDSVLRRKTFRPHPNKISSVLFYVASIIIHDCFHTSHKDYAISETSSYLDLSPLYGSNDEQQRKMRTFEGGRLKNDCFSDSRVHGFPPGVGILLIMFNRFHNDVVENLARIDEGGRFSSIKTGARTTGLTPSADQEKELTPEQLYDEALFQTGRLVTCGLYINIVLQDYVRTILGLNRSDTLWNLDPRANFCNEKIPQAGGNQVSAEFSLVYRWHSCVSERDEAWTDKLIDKVKNFPEGRNLMEKMAGWADKLAKAAPNSEDRKLENLPRDPKTGRYPDDELCQIWIDSVDDIAGAFGAAHVPENLMFVEILSMMQARRWNLASLNEFREYFKLAPHKTFESINPNPHIADQLKRLYGHPDNVEIYPGIVVESAKESMSPGSGLCASWTTSRAILADAVALVRGDRFYTVDYTPNNLTNWGFQRASSDQNINYGGVMYKLVLNAFPDHVQKNSIYAHYPLVNPGENEVLQKTLGHHDKYSYGKPEYRPVVNDALDQSSSTPLLAARTGVQKAYQKITFAEAVIKNGKWKTITEKFYTTELERKWKSDQYQLGSWQAIDVVDVLNEAHLEYIKSVLGIPLGDDWKETLAQVYDSAFTVDTAPHTVSRRLYNAASCVGSYLRGVKGPELGEPALAKMKEVNGHDASEQGWHDVLPTSALVFTTLSRTTARAVESILVDKGSQPADTIAARLGDKIVVTDLKNVQNPTADVVFARGVADIANKIILSIATTVKPERMPGAQGKIKTIITANGEVKYLNDVESEYVAFPTTMKIRWKK